VEGGKAYNYENNKCCQSKQSNIINEDIVQLYYRDLAKKA
jgi:hypothetical protein